MVLMVDKEGNRMPLPFLVDHHVQSQLQSKSARRTIILCKGDGWIVCNASCIKIPACNFCVYCASEGHAIYCIHSGEQH